MWTVLSAILAGIVIGALARLIMPGKQKIGILMTILLGAVGALVGAGVSSALFETGGAIWSPIPFVIGLVAAIVLIAIYVGISGGRGRVTRA